MMENYILYYNIVFYIILCYMKFLNNMKIECYIKELIVQFRWIICRKPQKYCSKSEYSDLENQLSNWQLISVNRLFPKFIILFVR